jgi:K+-transporting ATPase KdpF subunit
VNDSSRNAEQLMLENILLIAVCVCLFGYLLMALLRPEDF